MMLYRSRYAHVFSTSTKTIAFNSLTLQCWELTKEEADGLAVPESVNPIGDVGLSLIRAGLLVKNKEKPGIATSRLNTLRIERAKKRKSKFTTLRIALTEKCNMACAYCFQQALYPEAQPRMSAETLEREVTWFVEQAHGEQVTVQYFGGEPMMEWGLIQYGDKLLRDAKATGKISDFRQTITTNGTLMNPQRAQWLAEHDFDLIFSFDGPPEVNNRLRVFKNGRGTYDQAARGLRLWHDAGGRGGVLMTATELNLPHLLKYVRWFIEESTLPITTIALNSPQPTSDGWEVGGTKLAEVVFNTWKYCHSVGVEFQGPGTFIPTHLKTGIAQTDHCVDSGIFYDGAGAWPMYVSASGARSLCLVHHNDHRVQTSGEHAYTDGYDWHVSGPSPDSCDSCIASQICGGPCALERLFWGPKLSDDRCRFIQTMTRMVLTEG